MTYVQTCSHPKVKGATKAFFEAIARRLPDGETTTGPIALDDLAAEAKHTERTARTCRDVLEAHGLLKVHERGRGKVARYEILELAGTKPIATAPLPLLGRPKPPPRTNEQRSPSDLFSDVGTKEERSTSEVFSAVGTKEERSTSEVFSDVEAVSSKNVGSFFRRWVHNVGNFFRRLSPLGVDPRARDVQQLLTTTAAPPCRWRGTVHAWCAGRVHVPMWFHLEERRKLARLPGETDADLDAKQFAIYAQVLAGIPDTEEIRDVTEFDFWKRVLRSAPASGTAKARAPSGATHEPIPDNEIFARAKAERRQRYGGG